MIMKYLIYLALILSGTFSLSAHEVPSFMSKSPEEGLMEALEYYDIHHKEIVYAQAVLETGYFKSGGCQKGNNLFGLRGKHYHRYSHWSESVKAYKEKIQSRYRLGEDYYKFLKRIHYAENPQYINILKKIVNGKDRRAGEPSKGDK